MQNAPEVSSLGNPVKPGCVTPGKFAASDDPIVIRF